MSSVIQLDCFREFPAEKSVVLDRRRLNIAEALLGLNLKRSFHRIPHHQRAGEHGPGYDSPSSVPRCERAWCAKLLKISRVRVIILFGHR